MYWMSLRTGICLNTILKRKSGFRLDLIRMMNYSHLFRCLRVSELVGLNGTIEHYLPHRVAMQFGYDQDLPGSVTQLKHNSDTAWKNYIEVTKKVKLYLPSRLFEADVSARYMKWWKQSVSGLEDASEVAVPQKNKTKSMKLLLKTNHSSSWFSSQT
ncbi:hypothetical protein PS1_007367 [Malus domestica]